MTKNTGSDKDETQEIEAWRDEHGEPDFVFLRGLANAGTIESVEKLQSIAKDLDVSLDPNASADDIVDKITLAVQQSEDEDLIETN